MRRDLFLNWAKQNQKFLFLLLFALLLSGSIIAQKAWTLRECIEHALENNIQIKQSEITHKTNKAILFQTKLDFLPSVNAGSGYSINFGRSDIENSFTTETTKNLSFSFSAGLDIFGGFTKYNTMKQAQLNYLASQYDSDKMRDDISLMVAAAYLNVLFAVELVEKNKAQLEVTEQQISNTSKMVKAGTLPKGSLLEIQSQKASEELTLVNSENQLNLAYLDLMQLLELEATKEFKIAKPYITIESNTKAYNANEVYNISLARLPEIKASEYKLKSAEKGLAISRGYRSPTLTARYGWSTYYLDPKKPYLKDDDGDYILDVNNNPILGPQIPFSDQFKDNQAQTLNFSLNIPIFNGFQTSTNIQRSKLNVENSRYNLELAKNTVRKNIEQAYSDAIAAYKKYYASMKSVESFKESFKYMEKKFNIGMENSLNYNTAKAQLTKAESDLISAKYDYIFKTKILDFYMGIPLTLENK